MNTGITLIWPSPSWAKSPVWTHSAADARYIALNLCHNLMWVCSMDDQWDAEWKAAKSRGCISLIESQQRKGISYIWQNMWGNSDDAAVRFLSDSVTPNITFETKGVHTGIYYPYPRCKTGEAFSWGEANSLNQIQLLLTTFWWNKMAENLTHTVQNILYLTTQITCWNISAKTWCFCSGT